MGARSRCYPKGDRDLAALADPSSGSRQWEEPGAFEVAPGVYRIPLPLPGDSLRAVNVYLLLDDKNAVLIDAGMYIPLARKQLEESLKLLGVGMGDISDFLITHLHRDHYTQAVALRDDFGGRISLGALERSSMEIIGQRAFSENSGLTAERYSRLVECDAKYLIDLLRELEGDDAEFAALYKMPDLWLDDGREIELANRTLSVIATPGHTQGHVVFRDSNAKLLFAGDHVLPHITPSIGLEPANAPLPLGDFLTSLKKIRLLDDSRLFPAHGPIVDSTHRRIDELLLHHDQRLAQASKLLSMGRTTAHEVALELTWTKRQTKFDTLDPFNKMLAVTETMFHLDLLVHYHMAKMSTENGVRHYELC